MATKLYKVGEVARLTRVTVRTLHHYHAIGLLVPSQRNAAGYRCYGSADLRRLQQILLHRELGLALEEIRRLLDDPGFDRGRALRRQRQQLVGKRGTIDAMITAVDAALAELKGETTMDPKALFDGFDPSDYEEEAKQRWGDTEAYKESARRTKKYGEEQLKQQQAQQQQIESELARLLEQGLEADSEVAMDLAEQHRLHIDRWFYPCDHEMHDQLGQMYVSDERFKLHYDKRREGLAEFLSTAITANALRQV